MTGLELLGFLACGRLKERDSFVRLDEWKNMIITVRDGNFIDYWDKQMTWSEHNLNAEWEVYEEEEPKPKLDDWEKETCKRLLAKGYKWITRDKDEGLFADEDKSTKAKALWLCMQCVEIIDGFDFIKWEDKEPTSIEWLLGRE